jgi:hypothetical protein
MIGAMRWVALLVAAVLAACGPVAYVNQVTIHADDAVAEARAVEAEKYSPYYWTRATQYLDMAREVAAHADFQGANRFGRLAEEAAVKAKAEALAKRSEPAASAATPDAAPAVAPANGPIAPANGPIAPAKEPVAPAKAPVAPAKDATP